MPPKARSGREPDANFFEKLGREWSDKLDAKFGRGAGGHIIHGIWHGMAGVGQFLKAGCMNVGRQDMDDDDYANVGRQMLESYEQSNVEFKRSLEQFQKLQKK